MSEITTCPECGSKGETKRDCLSYGAMSVQMLFSCFNCGTKYQVVAGVDSKEITIEGKDGTA